MLKPAVMRAFFVCNSGDGYQKEAGKRGERSGRVYAESLQLSRNLRLLKFSAVIAEMDCKKKQATVKK